MGSLHQNEWHNPVCDQGHLTACCVRADQQDSQVMSSRDPRLRHMRTFRAAHATVCSPYRDSTGAGFVDNATATGYELAGCEAQRCVYAPQIDDAPSQMSYQHPDSLAWQSSNSIPSASIYSRTRGHFVAASSTGNTDAGRHMPLDSLQRKWQLDA